MRGRGDGVGFAQERDFVEVFGDPAGVDGGVQRALVDGWEGGGEVGGWDGDVAPADGEECGAQLEEVVG